MIQHQKMNRRRSIEPIRKQRTIFYNSSESTERPVEFYMHMFPEDVSLSIMPIGGRSSRPDFKVTISPADKRAEQIIVAGLNRSHSRDSLANALYDFLRMSAANLCVVDRLVFEIVYLEDRETKKPVGFELVFVNAKQIVEKGGQTYQFVPPEVAAENNVPELIPLSREDLITFKPPKDFEKPLRDMRAGLSQLDKMRLPAIMLEATKKNIPYDFKAHQRSMKLALVETVKPIGWYARGSFNDQVLSYYWIRLMLTFEKFKILLRNTMLATLNDGLQSAGQKLDFKAQIQIDGLPTLADVDTAIQNLSSGAMAFTEVMKPFKI
jgi:hypothetical protein